MRWLLLRGLGRESEHWDGFPRTLQEMGHSVELVDLPGAGTEYRRVAPLSIQSTVEDLRQRRPEDAGDPADPAKKTGIVAISLGGMVALDWASRYPNEVSKLVLINSSVSGLSAPWERLRVESLWTGLNYVFARSPEERELTALRITTGLSEEVLRTTAQRWVEIRKKRPVASAAVLRQLYAAFRFRLKEIPRCPMLVIKSMGDRLVSPICSDRLAEKTGASLKVHPTAGHDLPLEDPNWLARTITEWAAKA